jgi:uncharacterized protein involved in exopolysaccharide biosynthesis
MDKRSHQQISGPNPPQEAPGAHPADAGAQPAGPQLPSIGGIIKRTITYWYVTLIVAILGAGLTAVVVMKKKPAYRSEAVVQYQERAKTVYLGPDGPDPRRTLAASLKEMLLARSNLEKVVLDFNLFPDIVERRGMVDAVDRLKGKIIFKSRSTDTFAISYEGESREEAQEITQRLADLLVEENTRLRLSQVKKTTEFLDSEQKRAEQDVEKAEADLARFLADHPEFAAEQVQPGGTQTGASIRAQQQGRTGNSDPTLEALERQAPRLRSRLSGTGEQRPVPGGAPALSAPPALVQARQQADQELAAARRDLAEKQTRFTEQHPDVRAAATRAREAEAAAKRAEQALAAATAADPEAPPNSEAEKAKLRAELQKIEREISQRKNAKTATPPDASDIAKQIINVETEFARLTRAQTRARQVLSDVEVKASRADMAASSEQGGYSAQIVVLDPAYRPTSPSTSPRSVVAIGGLLASIVVGIALAAARGVLLDDRVYDMEDVARMALSPVLVVVPGTREAHGRGRRG